MAAIGRSRGELDPGTYSTRLTKSPLTSRKPQSWPVTCRARCAIERDSGVNGSPTGKFFIVAKRSSAERWGNVSSIVAHALENPYKNILIRNSGPSIFGAMTARRTWIDSLSDGFFEVSLDDTLRHLIMVYRKRE